MSYTPRIAARPRASRQKCLCARSRARGGMCVAPGTMARIGVAGDGDLGLGYRCGGHRLEMHIYGLTLVFRKIERERIMH